MSGDLTFLKMTPCLVRLYEANCSVTNTKLGSDKFERHVLQAMGLSEALQEGALRIGVGKFNTEDEIDRAAKEIVAAVDAVKASLPGEGR